MSSRIKMFIIHIHSVVRILLHVYTKEIQSFSTSVNTCLITFSQFPIRRQNSARKIRQCSECRSLQYTGYSVDDTKPNSRYIARYRGRIRAPRVNTRVESNRPLKMVELLYFKESIRSTWSYNTTEHSLLEGK